MQIMVKINKFAFLFVYSNKVINFAVPNKKEIVKTD